MHRAAPTTKDAPKCWHCPEWGVLWGPALCHPPGLLQCSVARLSIPDLSVQGVGLGPQRHTPCRGAVDQRPHPGAPAELEGPNPRGERLLKAESKMQKAFGSNVIAGPQRGGGCGRSLCACCVREECSVPPQVPAKKPQVTEAPSRGLPALPTSLCLQAPGFPGTNPTSCPVPDSGSRSLSPCSISSGH